MVQFHQLKIKNRRKKSRQVGRGGKRGKTSGRGTKGQKARAGRKLRPEMRDIIKKFPKKQLPLSNINYDRCKNRVSWALDGWRLFLL